jgi:glycosyltransferase involved in cell wall biosynthesis
MAVNARAERLLGVQADSLVYTTYYITRSFTYNLSYLNVFPPFRIVVQYLALLWACIRYQRFHFYCDAGLLPRDADGGPNRNELELLKELGKEVFFWTYGADVRTRGKTEALGPLNCCMDCTAVGWGCVCDDERGKARMGRVRNSASAVFAMGDMIEYTPSSRNDLFFWPVDLDADRGRKYAPSYPSADSSEPLHLVHAPNHREYKGTRFLIDAVKRLQEEDAPLRLTLVERIPNDEALRIYREADVIFDQCIVGFHGYFAIEAMAMGKPVMVFIRKPQEYLLHPDECPLINSPADKIESILRDLLQDRARLHDLGVRGRRYVEKYFSLHAFARRLDQAYQELREA